ncbi:MAG: hypothetical protein ACKPJD_13565, partial [Planctomycetaceae bacterium]
MMNPARAICEPAPLTKRQSSTHDLYVGKSPDALIAIRSASVAALVLSMKYLRPCIFVILTCALVTGVIYAAIAMYGLRGLPQDAYASDWTAIFIIEHLKATEDTWQSNWADLQDEFDRMGEPSHYAWSFAELQQRVNVQFDVTSEQV